MVDAQDDVKRKNLMLSIEFNEYLQNELFLKAFKDYCQTEFNTENLLFWLDVESFRLQETGNKSQHAQRIFDTYVSSEGQLQVNISQAMRNTIPQPLPEEVSNKVFDEIQSHIFDMMKIDSLPRFLKTDSFASVQSQRDTDHAKFQQHKIKSYSEFLKKLTVPA